MDANAHLVGVIRLQDQSVDVGEDVILAADILLDQVVLSIVVKDDMNLLGARAADVGTEHDRVRRLAMHVLLVQRTWEYLDIATSAVNVLLMLHRQLDNQCLVLVTD